MTQDPNAAALDPLSPEEAPPPAVMLAEDRIDPLEALLQGYTLATEPVLGPEPLSVPSLLDVRHLIEEARELLFPGVCDGGGSLGGTAAERLKSRFVSLARGMEEQVRRARSCLPIDPSAGAHSAEQDAAIARRVTRAWLAELPAVREALVEDAAAAIAGDPAAGSLTEIILCYPGHYAIMVHRLAHVLWKLGVPLLPRMMAEHAHRTTSIDIHPAAAIGSGFFIDHGTGVVVGATAVIGARVRLYQGVTLGALSLPKHKVQALRAGGKRHPTLEDDVVVYAGATILGGETVIGRGSVIGGNAWIVESVPPGSRVSVRIDTVAKYPSSSATLVSREASPRTPIGGFGPTFATDTNRPVL